jgi:hypothetical protein
MQLNSSATELITGITNLPLAVVALIAVNRLWHLRRTQPLRAGLWMGMFSGLAIATGLGIFAHGLALDPAARRLVWHPIYAALGLTVACFVAGAVLDRWSPSAAWRTLLLMLPVSAGFFVYATFYAKSFLPFILYEGVSMLFCLGVYLSLAVQRRLVGAGWVAAGVATTIVAASLQATSVTIQAGVSIDHNGLFHLVQLPGLICLLFGVKAGLARGTNEPVPCCRGASPLSEADEQRAANT